MNTEPDTAKHHIFLTLAAALDAWNALPEEQRAKTPPPRQSHGCWIFDKDPG